MVLTFEGYTEVNSSGGGRKDRKGRQTGGGRRSHRKGTAAEARAMFGVGRRTTRSDAPGG